MVEDSPNKPPGEDAEAPPELRFGEEELGENVSGRDLLAAGGVGLVALGALVLALRLPNPGSVYTAPALFPIVIAGSLLCMAIGLGVSAWRRDGWTELLRKSRARTGDEVVERWRTVLLILLVAIYVVLVDFISFDLRYPTRLLDLRFSSYEAVSIPFLTLVLRIFWRAPWTRCLLVALILVMSLAWVFRSGFKILLPGSG